MRPEARKLLVDMAEAVRAVEEFAAGKSRAEFSADKMFRSAVYYQFVVLGEALARLRGVDEPTAERITEYWRIIGFRNQIIHGYAKIDDEITWRIIETKTPVLREELRALLNE